MSLPIISTFPLDKPFELQKDTTQLSEIGLRIIVNFYSDNPYVIGTGVLLCGQLLLSAKHVLDMVWDLPPHKNAKEIEIKDKRLVALQLLPGPEYIVWDIVSGNADPISDLVLFQLSINPGRSHPYQPYIGKKPHVNPFPPQINQRVAAFGYRKSIIAVSKNPSGGNHIVLVDEPIVSIGVVQEVHEISRDSCMLPFPCYQVSARFDSGMSGGPVFDETGALCGIICANFDAEDSKEPISYVTTLFPLFRLMITMNRGGNYPRGVKYPVIDLARDGQIVVTDIQKLEQMFRKRN